MYSRRPSPTPHVHHYITFPLHTCVQTAPLYTDMQDEPTPHNFILIWSLLQVTNLQQTSHPEVLLIRNPAYYFLGGGETFQPQTPPNQTVLIIKLTRTLGFYVTPVCHNLIDGGSVPHSSDRPVFTREQGSMLLSSFPFQSLIYCSCKLIFLGGQMASFVPLIENQHSALCWLGSLERGPGGLIFTELVNEPNLL